MTPGITHKAVLFFFLAGSLLLQLVSIGVRGQAPPNFVPSYQTVSVYDVNGHMMANGAPDVEGTPLFIPKWKLGLIRLVDGRSFTAVPVEIDLERQIVHYKQAGGGEQEIQPGLVSQVILLDTIASGNVTYEFVTGYPSIDNQTTTNFYLLLDSGRVNFLESVRKRYVQEKNEYTTETTKEYRVYEDFYVFIQGKITRIKKEAKFFLGLTTDKYDQMVEYLNNNKISFKSTQDIWRFLHYYNGLP